MTALHSLSRGSGGAFARTFLWKNELGFGRWGFKSGDTKTEVCACSLPQKPKEIFSVDRCTSHVIFSCTLHIIILCTSHCLAQVSVCARHSIFMSSMMSVWSSVRCLFVFVLLLFLSVVFLSSSTLYLHCDQHFLSNVNSVEGNNRCASHGDIPSSHRLCAQRSWRLPLLRDFCNDLPRWVRRHLVLVWCRTRRWDHRRSAIFTTVCSGARRTSGQETTSPLSWRKFVSLFSHTPVRGDPWTNLVRVKNESQVGKWKTKESGLSLKDKKSKLSLKVEPRFENASSKPILAGEVSRSWVELLSLRREIDHAFASDEQLQRDQQLLQEQLSNQNRDFREAHMKSLDEMEDLKRFQGSTFDTFSRRRLIEEQNTILEFTARIQELQNEVNCLNDSRDLKDAELVRSGQSHVPSQPALLPPFRVPGGMLSRSVGMPSRNDKPPNIWDTHGASGNILVNPTASSSAPNLEGFDPWIPNFVELTSSHVTSERQTPDTPLDPRCQSGLSARNSFDLYERRLSKEYGADPQRLHSSDLQKGKFPTPTTFSCWKMRFKTEVWTCSQFPAEPVPWIKEVELVDSVDNLEVFAFCQRNSWAKLWVSTRELLQHWTESSKLPTSRKRSVWRWKLKKKTASPEEDRPRVIGANDSVENHADLFAVVLRNDDVQEFDSEWDEIARSHLTTSWKDCTKFEYESLRNSRPCWNCAIWRFTRKKSWTWSSQIEGNGKKKYRAEFANEEFLRPEMEILKQAPWSRIKGWNSVKKKSLGYCWQWKANGQCSKGDNRSFLQDMNKCARATQLNPSLWSSTRPNETNALGTRSPRGRNHGGKMTRLPCKDCVKGTCTNSFCKKCHPECLFYKTKSGCRFEEKCSCAHRQVDEQLGKRSENNGGKSAVALLKIARQLVAYFKIWSRRSLHRFCKAVVRHANIRDKIHHLEWFAQGIFHQRDANAPIFEGRSQEETEWQERCARKAAWKLAKSVLKLREKNKATFFSFLENRCLPTSTIKPEETEFVADSGASMNMIGKKDLNSAELTVTTSRSPTTVITANGEVQRHEEASWCQRIGCVLDKKVFNNTPAVLSLGKALRWTRILLRLDQQWKNCISSKTVFGATWRTSFWSWFLDCQRVLLRACLLQHPWHF